MVLEYAIHYAVHFLDLLIDIGPWMLLGFFIAAFVEEFIPTDRLIQYFGRNNLSSIARATIAGLFVSMCSCGAIPLAASLRRRGASTATSLTFLLATPWAGFTHILIMMNFTGLLNALILFILSLVVAFCTGLVLARLENRGIIEAKLLEKETTEVQLCYAAHFEEPLFRRLFYCVPNRMWEIFKDIGKYIFIGLFIAAFLAAFVPFSIVQLVLGGSGLTGIPSILIALPIAVLIELCSEGFTILAGQLFVMGASLAVVFTLTLVGVSTDFTELSMIWGKFGKRSTLAYLSISTSLVVALAVGLLFL